MERKELTGTIFTGISNKKYVIVFGYENGEVVFGEMSDLDYVIEMSTLVSEAILKNDLIQKYDHFREIEQQNAQGKKQ